MNIGSDVAETGAHRVLSFFAEIINALPELVITLLPSLFRSIQPVAQERHVRVQPLTELLERLPYLLVVNL